MASVEENGGGIASGKEGRQQIGSECGKGSGAYSRQLRCWKELNGWHSEYRGHGYKQQHRDMT